MATTKITSWTDGFPHDSTWVDLTPKGDKQNVQRIDLAELGITLRTSDETLREIDQMRIEQMRLRMNDKTIFD